MVELQISSRRGPATRNRTRRVDGRINIMLQFCLLSSPLLTPYPVSLGILWQRRVRHPGGRGGEHLLHHRAGKGNMSHTLLQVTWSSGTKTHSHTDTLSSLWCESGLSNRTLLVVILTWILKQGSIKNVLPATVSETFELISNKTHLYRDRNRRYKLFPYFLYYLFLHLCFPHQDSFTNVPLSSFDYQYDLIHRCVKFKILLPLHKKILNNKHP